MRSLKPSYGWLGWLGGAAAAWLWALEKGGQAAWFVASATGFILLYALLIRLTALSGPNVSCVVLKEQVKAGERVQVTIDLQRTRVWFPFVWMEIRDGLIDMEGKPVCEHRGLIFAGLRKHIRYTYEIAGLPRGVYTFAPLALALREPLGIASKRQRSDGMAQRRLTVYPQPLADIAAALHLRGGALGDAAAWRATMSGESSLVSTVRDYAHGDPLQRIHWKSTARAGGLKTKELDALHIRRVTVVLDDAADVYGSGRKGRSRFETAASAAAAVIADAKRQGLASELRCGAHARHAAEEAPSPDAQQAMAMLAAAKPGGERSLAQVLREQAGQLAAERSLVLITPRLDAPLIDCVGLLRARRVPVAVIYVSDKLQPAQQADAFIRQLGEMRCPVSIAALPASAGHHARDKAAGGASDVGA